MVQIDWEKIRRVKAVSLTDNEIEDLFPMVIQCEIEEVNDIYNLRALIKLSQEMLQYKDNQVESLLIECDEMKKKISLSKKIDKGVINEKDNNETRIRNLNSPNDNYMDSVRKKNDKIKTLMLELESLEKENIDLKIKLDNLKEEMEDATVSMNEMTDELNDLRGKNIVLKDNIDNLKQEKIALLNQIEEIASQQIDRDKIIDDFGTAIDVRVSEWKNILDSKDNEIVHLKNELLKFQLHPPMSVNTENISQVVYLNDEIAKRDKIITELESKLLEATAEINDSAELIEKLKIDMRQMEKSGKRKEHRDLLKKVQFANEKISLLQLSVNELEDNLTLKSRQLCEVMENLRRYEDKDHGLTDTINELKELKKQLSSKNNYIQDMVTVINKLEDVNSHQEMQIIALREKLGLSEEDEISIEGVAMRYQEEAKIKDELIKRTELLEQENFDLKSDIRILKFKLNKLDGNVTPTRDTIDAHNKSLQYQNIQDNDWTTTNREIIALHYKNNITEIQESARIVIEENEALRKGMHEILDSIRDHDGKGNVEVHSDTLEKLLEALDIRHVAGWYHPAMRLQERINVVQGSNSELRSQLKQMRKEIQKKDNLLRQLGTPKLEYKNSKLSGEESDCEDLTVYVKEMQQIQETYRNELEEWQQARESLNKENNELKETNEKLMAQLKIFQADLSAIANSEDDIKVALASRSKELAELTVDLIISTRKCKTMEELLNRESVKIYNIQKEAFATESNYKKLLADMEKRNELMENNLQTLENNLSNSVKQSEFNQLKEKYSEVNLRLRVLYELQLSMMNHDEDKISKDQSEGDDKIQDQSLGEIHEESKQEKIHNENNIDEIRTINLHLQRQLIELQNFIREKLQLTQRELSKNTIIELENEIKIHRIENENLLKSLTISRDEAQMYYTINSLKILEVDNLRHQILDLQAVSEDKEIIAQLGFELNSCKAAEMEINRRKIQLENEISHLQNNLKAANDKYNEAKIQLDDYRRHCDNKCRNYMEVIDFLQNQYSGSTSITSLQRFGIMLRQLTNDRAQIDLQLKAAKDYNEQAKIQQETLTNRLEIVDRLKDILEQQIGSTDLDNLMHSFSENSQSALNEYRYKRRITQLETELQITINKLHQYESTIAAMECDIVNIQKIWKNKIETPPTIIYPQSQSETTTVSPEKKSVSVEARVEHHSVQVQSDPCEFTTVSEISPIIPEPVQVDKIVPITRESVESSDDTTASFLQDQLNQALALASDRSAKLIKYESQITEYKAKIDALDKAIVERDVQLIQKNKLLEQQKSIEIINNDSDVEGVVNDAYKSTINSLKKIISQKEETIARYQLLLKEDRDEHTKVTSRLQEEIKNLELEIVTMKKEVEINKLQKNIYEIPERDILPIKSSDELKKDQKIDIEVEEKIVRLNEQVSTLEADLHIANELSERWRRLADERLHHMDEMRERLEAQHKSELDTYRLELDKWQSETTGLRQQLSENRMKLAKGNISLSKELQDRDNKIEELTMLHQQLQNELEIMESMGQLQPQISAHSSGVTKIPDYTQTFVRHDSSNHVQSELDLLRRQHKSITEKEKMYKEQIADLRQQLSRRYMAEKSEEKKTSQREAQLERKLKNMEDELNKARIQLDREYRNQEAKRVKTAEELSLWEKQKKWQQIAEKLKKELKDKTDEYKKLNINCDKLKSIISCMEREKWYLRSKIRSENGVINGLSAKSDFNVKIVEDLQKECQILRDRISELTDRLESENNHELMIQIEKQKQRISALDAVTEGNTFIVDQLEKLESAKCNLEKANIKLESENFELRMEIEKLNSDTPRLKEKVEHLEKYVELLKVEKSPESSSGLSEKNHENGSKKSVIELERTVFVLKRIVEKLQTENKRLKINSKNNNRSIKSTSIPTTKINIIDNDINLKRQLENAKKRIIALETDLQLADQRIEMLTITRRDDDNTDEINILKHQLSHKSDLLDKVKQLLMRAAINEKALRQRIQQFELKQTLSTIPECLVTSPTNN